MQIRGRANTYTRLQAGRRGKTTRKDDEERHRGKTAGERGERDDRHAEGGGGARSRALFSLGSLCTY
jgi:hypothetical protein